MHMADVRDTSASSVLGQLLMDISIRNSAARDACFWAFCRTRAVIEEIEVRRNCDVPIGFSKGGL